MIGPLITGFATTFRHMFKKPITVSPREDGGYDLICGQGRLEAFIALGQTEIPAVIAEATPEDAVASIWPRRTRSPTLTGRSISRPGMRNATATSRRC